jgi:hypothetical protein
MHSWRRFIAAFLALLVFVTNSVLAHAVETNFWSQRRNADMRNNASAMAGPGSALAHIVAGLPLRYGTIRSVTVPPTTFTAQRVVIHIQDVHLNQDAQANIAHAIEVLLQQKHVDLVALEGASGAIDLRAFQNDRDRDAMRNVSNYLLKTNEISGPIHAAFTSPVPFPPIVGIDDARHYRANVDAYKNAQTRVKKQKFRLAAARADLEKMKATQFNKRLWSFDQGVQSYRGHRTTLADHLRVLRSVTPSHSEQVSIFWKALALEAQLDPKRLKTDRAQQELYGRYAQLIGRMNAERLLRDVEQWEQSVYASLARTEAEKKLIERSRYIYLTGKLLDFSLTRDDWVTYETLKPALAGMEVFERFYHEAEARDHAMSANILNAMDHRRAAIAILVTGGFHAAGIDAALQARGIATVTYVPRIATAEVNGARAALSAFTQEKTPLEKIFNGEKLFLAPPVWTPAKQVLTTVLLSAQRMWRRTGRTYARFERGGVVLKTWLNPVDGAIRRVEETLPAAHRFIRNPGLLIGFIILAALCSKEPGLGLLAAIIWPGKDYGDDDIIMEWNHLTGGDHVNHLPPTLREFADTSIPRVIAGFTLDERIEVVKQVLQRNPSKLWFWPEIQVSEDLRDLFLSLLRAAPEEWRSRAERRPLDHGYQETAFNGRTITNAAMEDFDFQAAVAVLAYELNAIVALSTIACAALGERFVAAVRQIASYDRSRYEKLSLPPTNMKPIELPMFRNYLSNVLHSAQAAKMLMRNDLKLQTTITISSRESEWIDIVTDPYPIRFLATDNDRTDTFLVRIDKDDHGPMLDVYGADDLLRNRWRFTNNRLEPSTLKADIGELAVLIMPSHRYNSTKVRAPAKPLRMDLNNLFNDIGLDPNLGLEVVQRLHKQHLLSLHENTLLPFEAAVITNVAKAIHEKFYDPAQLSQLLELRRRRAWRVPTSAEKKGWLEKFNNAYITGQRKRVYFPNEIERDHSGRLQIHRADAMFIFGEALLIDTRAPSTSLSDYNHKLQLSERDLKKAFNNGEFKLSDGRSAWHRQGDEIYVDTGLMLQWCWEVTQGMIPRVDKNPIAQKVLKIYWEHIYGPLLTPAETFAKLGIKGEKSQYQKLWDIFGKKLCVGSASFFLVKKDACALLQDDIVRQITLSHGKSTRQLSKTIKAPGFDDEPRLSQLDEGFMRMTETLFHDAIQHGALLKPSSRQVLKLWLYHQLSTHVPMAEMMDRLMETVIPGLMYLQDLGDNYNLRDLGATITARMDVDALKINEFAKFFLDVGGEVPETPGIYLLAGNFQVLYLNFLMHARLGIFTVETDVRLWMNGYWSDQLLLFLVPLYFAFVPRPDRIPGLPEQNGLQASFTLPNFSWEQFKRNDATLPGGKKLSGKYPMSILLQQFSQWPSLVAWSYSTVSGGNGVLNKIRQDLWRVYDKMRDADGAPLLTAGEIEGLLALRAMSRAQQSVSFESMLKKLHGYFLKKDKELLTFQEAIEKSLQQLRDLFFKVHPETRVSFDAVYLGGPEYLHVPEHAGPAKSLSSNPVIDQVLRVLGFESSAEIERLTVRNPDDDFVRRAGYENLTVRTIRLPANAEERFKYLLGETSGRSSENFYFVYEGDKLLAIFPTLARGAVNFANPSRRFLDLSLYWPQIDAIRSRRFLKNKRNNGYLSVHGSPTGFSRLNFSWTVEGPSFSVSHVEASKYDPEIKVTDESGGFQFDLPVLPTVYSPSARKNAFLDVPYYDSILSYPELYGLHMEEHHNPKTGMEPVRSIAVIGAGSGSDVVAVYWRWLQEKGLTPAQAFRRADLQPALTIREVNPFAVAGLHKVVRRLGLMNVTVEEASGLPSGHFDLVLWNMPEATGNDDAEDGGLAALHDHGSNGRLALREVRAGLAKILNAGGMAILWNAKFFMNEDVNPPERAVVQEYLAENKDLEVSTLAELTGKVHLHDAFMITPTPPEKSSAAVAPSPPDLKALRAAMSGA